MDIVVKGRKTEVPERFRKHVAEKLKLEKIQKLDGKVISLDVEVSKEPNPRQADRCDRVEITLRSRGPVIRAEAAAGDPYAALDLAADKLEARLRKQHDKRYTRRGNGRHLGRRGRRRRSGRGDAQRQRRAAVHDDEPDAVPTNRIGSLEVQGEGPLVVREKTHVAAPMTLDQALYEMELVGHDFYLFVDSETKEPSVVYRRHAYDYGVIHLSTDPMAAARRAPGGGRRARRLTPPGDSRRRCPWSAVCAPRGTRVRPLGVTAPLSSGHEIMAHGQPVRCCLGLATAHGLQATAFRGRNDGGQLRAGARRRAPTSAGGAGMGPDARRLHARSRSGSLSWTTTPCSAAAWRSCSRRRRTSRSSARRGTARRRSTRPPTCCPTSC